MATSSELKKHVERHYLERFIEAFTDFPNGNIEPTEEPDFLIHVEDRSIGVELTELHQDAAPNTRPLQANEAMRQRVVAWSPALYELGGDPRFDQHFLQFTQ